MRAPICVERPRESRYLHGLEPPTSTRKQGHRTLFLWIVLIVMFVAIWQFLQPPPDKTGRAPAPRPPAVQAPHDPLIGAATSLGYFALFCGLGFLVTRKSFFPRPDPILAAETSVLREDLDDAVARARAIASPGKGKAAPHRAYGSAMVILGRVAELRCEFADAEQIYARAVSSLSAFRGLYRTQMQTYYRAHRAFALAALGRLDEADAELAQADHKDSYPGTDALVARARAVVLSKRGRQQELLRHLTETGTLTKRNLTLRDRLLLRALGAYAKSTLEPAMRVSGADLGLEPEVRAWVGAIVPETLARLEAR